MRVRLGFSQTADRRFLVVAGLAALHSFGVDGPLSTATFDHEDAFVALVLAADLSDSDMRQVVSTALLSICLPVFPQRWVEAELTAEQAARLHLHLTPSTESTSLDHPQPDVAALAFGLIFDLDQLTEFLQDAPTPFAAFSGPEHILRFGNLPYQELTGLGRTEDVIGLPVRSVFSEAEGPPFSTFLDQAYQSGEPYVGKEVLARTRLPGSDLLQDGYFDFICFPARNALGEVAGILLQATDVTGRVLARRASDHRECLLFTQWAELDAIYKATPVGMALFDAKTFHVLRINQKQAELMGGSVDELVGKSALELAANLPGFAALLQKAKEDQGVLTAVLREPPDEAAPRGRRWLVNLSPALGSTEEVNAISSIFLEVPARAGLEGTLDTASSNYFDVLESFTDGLFVLDRSWNFIYLNSRARAILHHGEDVLGRNMWEEYPLAKDLPFWEPYHLTMEKGVPAQFEVFYPEPLFRWFDIRSFPARDGMSVFFRDITETKLEKQALRESEARFRTLMDHSPQVLWTMSPTGDITDFGGPWEEMTGLTRAETLGRGFMAAVHPDDAGQLIDILEKALARSIPFDIEWRIVHRGSGIHCWVRSRGKPVLGVDGKALKYYGNTEDVDEVMQLRRFLKDAQVSS